MYLDDLEWLDFEFWSIVITLRFDKRQASYGEEIEGIESVHGQVIPLIGYPLDKFPVTEWHDRIDRHTENILLSFYYWYTNYRVTHQVVANLPLTSKQKFHFGLSWPGQAKTEL